MVNKSLLISSRIILILAAAIYCQPAYSQDAGSSDEFTDVFSKDEEFVKNPTGQEQTKTPTPKPSKTKSSGGFFDDQNQPDPAATQTNSALEDPAINPEQKIRNPKYISAIINLSDSQHFIDQAEELMRIVEKTKIPLKTVFAAGKQTDNGASLQILDSKLDPVSYVVLLNAMNFNPAMPPEYANVQKSPAWIIGTDEGEVILEGYRNPEIFLK